MLHIQAFYVLNYFSSFVDNIDYSIIFLSNSVFRIDFSYTNGTFPFDVNITYRLYSAIAELVYFSLDDYYVNYNIYSCYIE